MAQQGTGPITDVSLLRGDFWPDDENVEDFIAAYREWRGHKRPEPVTMGVVDPLDAIIEDMKARSPEKLKMAADFISRLKGSGEKGGGGWPLYFRASLISMSRFRTSVKRSDS